MQLDRTSPRATVVASLRRLARAVARRWYWLLLAPLVMVLWTAFHEGCHAVAAVALGAELREFVVWPTFSGAGGGLRYGYVSYTFDDWSAPRPYWLIGAAPYFGDTAVALLGAALLRPRPGSVAATAALVLVFAGALFDALNAWSKVPLGVGDLGELFAHRPWAAAPWGAAHLGLHFALTWRAARVALAGELSAPERAACIAGLTGAVVLVPVLV